MTPDTHPLAGILTNGIHRLTQRVYYEDTDFSGLVYHARYLHFLERGRTDFLRLAGVDQSALKREQDLAFVVAHMDIRFRSPARMDDIVTVETRIAEKAAARMVMAQMLKRGEDVLVEARVTVAAVDSTGRPRRLPILNGLTVD